MGHLPPFLFDIFCACIAKKFILGNMQSMEPYAKQFSEGLEEFYEPVNPDSFSLTAQEIILFLSEIEAGEDAVSYLNSFNYNRLYFSNLNIARKMNPLFGSVIDPVKEKEYNSEVMLKNLKAFVFNLRADSGKAHPVEWEINTDEHMAKFKELLETEASIFDTL